MASVLATVFLLTYNAEVHVCINNTWTDTNDNAEAKAVAVDKTGNPWVLTSSWHLHYFDATANLWKDFDDSVEVVSFAVSKSGAPYIVSKTPAYIPKKWSGSRWEVIPEKKVLALALDGDDNLWIIDTGRNVLHQYEGKWYNYPGSDGAMAIAVTEDSDVYILNTANKVFRGTMKGWVEIKDSAAKDIAVDSAGVLWAIGLDDRIWYLDEGDIWRHYGGTAIGQKIAVF